MRRLHQRRIARVRCAVLALLAVAALFVAVRCSGDAGAAAEQKSRGALDQQQERRR